MGINVSENFEVTIDDSHQKRVDTSIENNPRTGSVTGLPVHHVFRRNKTGDLDRDGNPLIYALKHMKGYTISEAQKRLVFDRAREVLTSMEKPQVEWVLPIPSSKKFCSEFANLVSCVLQIPVYAEVFIGKCRVGDVLEKLKADPPEITSPTKARLYKGQLSNWEKLSPSANVSMKEVPRNIRKYVTPFQVTQVPDELVGSRVVLVDDLKSSGTSMRHCNELLSGFGVNVVSGIYFLSGL